MGVYLLSKLNTGGWFGGILGLVAGIAGAVILWQLVHSGDPRWANVQSWIVKFPIGCFACGGLFGNYFWTIAVGQPDIRQPTTITRPPTDG